MHYILVDPILLSIPDTHTPQQQKATYLKSLNLWREMYLTTITGDCDWNFSKAIAQVLKDNQLFPDTRKLRRLLTAANAHPQSKGKADHPSADVNVDSIVRWLLRLWEEAHNIDGIFDLTNTLLEEKLTSQGYGLIEMNHEHITCMPSDFLRWPPSIQQITRLLLGHLVMSAHLQHSYAGDLAIATLPLSDQIQGAKEVNVSAKIGYISSREAKMQLVEGSVSHTFPLLLSSTDLPFSLDEWQWDGTEESLSAAINREYDARYRILVEELQRSRQEKQKGEKAAKLKNTVRQYPIPYIFGSHFLEMLQEVAKDVARENLPKRFVQTAASIIADHVFKASRSNVKHLRESKGGSVSHHKRDKDDAWRVYITPNHGGWRLNYWRGPDDEGRERIEFSVIQKKEEKEKIYYD